MEPCNKKVVQAFDYSKLDDAFEKLSKPAKRALIRHHIYTPKHLMSWTLGEVMEFHGLGPASIPVLKAILARSQYKFKT